MKGMHKVCTDVFCYKNWGISLKSSFYGGGGCTGWSYTLAPPSLASSATRRENLFRFFETRCCCDLREVCMIPFHCYSNVKLHCHLTSHFSKNTVVRGCWRQLEKANKQWTCLNACENLGAIVKDRVEKKLETSGEALEEVLHQVLSEMEYDTELFVSLLSSYPSRLTSVREANGGQTKF